VATADASTLHSIISTLSRFNQFDPKMQVSTVLTLLEIASAEERGDSISVQDIEKRVGLQSGTSSRNVYYWAEGHKDMRGGQGMVSIGFAPDDRRRRSLRLTNKGKAFIRELVGGGNG